MTLGHPETPDRISLEIEFDEDDGLVADDPAVVLRLDRDDTRRAAFYAAAIRVLDVDPPAREKTDMRVHAVLGADDRFHVDRPSKSRRVDHALHARVAGTPRFEANVADVAAHDVLERPEKGITWPLWRGFPAPGGG
jgi:hypothetical protein